MAGIKYYYTASGRQELILTKGRNYPWHMHVAHWTMGAVCSGSALLTSVAGTRVVQTGECFLFAPYEPHALRMDDDSSLLVVCAGNMEDLRGSMGLVFSGSAPWQDAMCLVQAVWREHVVDCGQKPCSGNSGSSCMTLALRSVMQRMLEHPGDSWDVGHMAAYAGYSRWHFSRAFQRYSGLTPHAFQLLCRLRMARALLREDTAAADLAVSSGFSDQSHLHKVFKQYQGLTPQQFRQASLKVDSLQERAWLADSEAFSWRIWSA